MSLELGYGRAFFTWRTQAAEAWHAYTHHSFVEGLRDGSLPRDAYINYLKQDYVFLVHFSRAWGLAIAKSETLEEMKAAAATVAALVDEEMQLHVATCAEHGISETELIATPEAPENLAYTRYVLEAGYSGDWLDLMAALAPCVLGYGEIGARLSSDATHEAYRKWIETYAGEEYQGACKVVGALIDTGLERRLGYSFIDSPRWSSLSSRFVTATKLEADFWGMGLRLTANG